MIESSQNEFDKLIEKRNYRVVKHNDLIQRTRFELNAQQQRIILYLISQIKPTDKEFIEVEFSIQEFCMLCGIDEKSGKNYLLVKEAIKELRDKSRWIDFGDEEALVSWIISPRIKRKSGTIKLWLDPNLSPFLLQIRKNFTEYELFYILAMKSQYSIRIYEILKSYDHEPQPLRLDINELKKALVAETYVLFGNFKQKVLDVAMREINELTDLSVTYEPRKIKSRGYNKIDFTYERKEALEAIKTIQQVNDVLSSRQTSLFD